ncbi:hypothetical protein CBR_g54639 [Chara braunii]|uniref:Integrase catalytic domain-containing protein n=1 Tax=Chara braunii TaxID=69332 RepID=A0A388MC97_CHABU|nr:hypothetical protein CBR_g54639 [Chara braunii]|eukprot:GBG92194.1 hypothetical protein CBR_g54639 [Chara braunii]
MFRLGKGIAMEEEIEDQQSKGNQGTNGDGKRNEGSARDRESAKLKGTREDKKGASIGESSGKVWGSKSGPQEDREGGNDMRTSPRNSVGATPKMTKVSDASRKLAEIEKQTAEFKARLVEQMMAEDEEDPQGAGSREGRRTGQDEARYEGKDNSHKGTPSKNGKDKNDPPTEETENAMTPPAIDSGTSRLPATPKVREACDKLWNLRERVLRWFDPEGTPKTREKQRESKEGEGTSAAGEAGGSEDGLKRIAAVEAEPIAEIVWDQPLGRGPQTNFIIEGNDQDRVNITTRRAGAEKKLIQDTVMEELAGTSTGQQETEAEKQEKVYGKPREDETVDKATAAKKKFRYQISILTSPEIDGTLSKLLGTMVSVSFQTMLQASPRLLKGVRQLLTRKCIEVEEAPELQEQDTKEAEVPQLVSNLQSIPGGLGDLEKAFADIRLSLPNREGGEVKRAPPETKLSFHALPVGKLKVQIGTHHTDALVDGRPEITLIRRNFATVTGCMINKEVAGSIRGADGEIPFIGYVTKCAVRAGIRESTWSFQRTIVMEEMDHDVILGRPWCANVEMIGIHLHNDTYMVDIEDPVTGRGELLRLLGTGGDPPKGELATWSPTFEESARKGAFARMEGMRERVEIIIEEAFSKKEWIKMGLPVKKRRLEDESLGVTVAEKEQEVELGASLPKPKEGRKETPELALEIPNLLQLVKAIRYHKVGADPAALAKFEDEVRKGYCLNGKIVSIQPRLRNRADGLSRVCITPEGVEDAEPIDAFLEYEGGTLVVDHEMANPATTTGQLLIQTLENGAPGVVAELREGPLTTVRRRKEKNSWGGEVGAREELMAMTVEGGGDAVMTLAEAWAQKECQYLVNLTQEEQGTNEKEQEFFLIQMYEGVFKEIGLLLVRNKQPTKVSPKAREEVEKYILDARDNLSGYVEVIVLKKKTGKAVADCVEDFYLRHPFVRRFITDNGTKFVNQEVLNRLKTLCVPIKITEPYHPEANALVERGHRTLKNTIAKLAADNLGSWARFLKQAVFAENMTPKRTTGCIPAELWYGREIDFPIEALVPTWNRLDDDPHSSTEELITPRGQQVARNEEALEEVVNRVADSRMRDKARWDQVKNIRKEPLQVGEKVLVRNSALESTWSRQQGKRFKGPYRIAKRMGLNTFELEDLDDTSIRGQFPGQRLVRFFSRDLVEQWLHEAQDRERGEVTA